MFSRFFIILCCAAYFFYTPELLHAASNAQPITIICNNSDNCQQVGKTEAFFSATNIVPGYTTSRIITVHNQRKDDGCELGIAARLSDENQKNTLQEELTLTIATEGKTLASTPIEKLISSAAPLFVDTLNPKSKREYLWTVVFNQKADNSYQGSSSILDLDISFTCDKATREPLPPAKDNNPKNELTSSTTECTATAPTQAPTLSIIPNKNTPSTARLRWNTIPKANSYKLTFGTTDSQLQYSDIDVGNTTEYSPLGLQTDKNYFFVVTAVTGCAVGPSSARVFLERTSVIQSTHLNESSISDAGLPSPTASLSGQILGIETENTRVVNNPTQNTKKRPIQPTIYMGSFILLLLVLYIFFFIKRKRKKSPSAGK